jgi:hypothetical protein
MSVATVFPNGRLAQAVAEMGAMFHVRVDGLFAGCAGSEEAAIDIARLRAYDMGGKVTVSDGESVIYTAPRCPGASRRFSQHLDWALSGAERGKRPVRPLADESEIIAYVKAREAGLLGRLIKTIRG